MVFERMPQKMSDYLKKREEEQVNGLDEIIKDAVVQVLNDYPSLLDKDNWFKDFYPTTYSFSNVEELSNMSSMQFSTAKNDRVVAASASVNEIVFNKLGINSNPQTVFAEQFAKQVESVVFNTLYDHIDISKEDMLEKMSKVNELESIDLV